MLEVKGLSVSYGAHPALDDVSLTVDRGEIVVILGANGAGKSTLLRAISGICEGHSSGSVTLEGESLTGLDADAIVERGLALVPEGRGIFGDLTVRENLLLGAYAERARADEASNLERVYSLFPKLRERERQVARTMSGGEQQMVAIGRAMMSAPDVLMLDEPSLGLSPMLCKELFASLAQVRDAGIGILLVEQNARQSLAIADRGYLLENTRITHADTAARLATDPVVQKAYLGVGSKTASATTANAPVIDTETPKTKPDFTPRATPRRTADQQVGFSIDGLVAEAAQQSATAAQPQPATEKGGTVVATAAADGRLSAVIRDIEQAAANARRKSDASARKQQPAVSRLARDVAQPRVPSPSAASDEPPVVIEVYRRPRVEVYRRGPDGTHRRD